MHCDPDIPEVVTCAVERAYMHPIYLIGQGHDALYAGHLHY